jgi:WXG100 family type VII secretion target
MPADTVQVDHDAMASISQRFGDQSDQVRAQYDKIMHQLDVLKNGAWIGPNADKYAEIMEGTLLPAIQRLFKALDQAGNTTKEVAKMMRDADEETKSLFPV